MEAALRERLARGLGDLGLNRPQALELLTRYWDELALWNPKYGLVNATGTDLVDKHFLDCAAAAPLLARRSPATLADVGSGGGLPGLVLAALLPDTALTLIEKSGRRCRFLENAVLALGLAGRVRVHEGDVAGVSASFDVVTFRAVSALDPGFAALVRPRVGPGGVLAAYKGRREVIDAELTALGAWGQSAEVCPLTVPNLGDERHLVLLPP